jgi:hypothetical protein
MKASSAKAKGRALVKSFAEGLSNALGINMDEFTITPSGVNGEDLVPSPYARKLFPYSVEGKSRARIAIYEWMKQAEGHGHEPLLVVKQNRSTPLVIMKQETFYKMIKDARIKTNKDSD